MTYEVITVDENVYSQLEQLGTKAKFWYLDQNNRKFLFKEGRPGTGENWSEKVCCEIANLLGIPHALYDLAVFRGRKGTITLTFVPDHGRLIHGNELLAAFHRDYDQESRYRANQHTLLRAVAALKPRNVLLPLHFNPPFSEMNAIGVFSGYLMLDTLVGNQDRHHENWGMILSPDNSLNLAPTYDHASSLGRNETDVNRNKRLTTKDKGQSVEHYATRALSGFYDTHKSIKPLSTLDAFDKCAKLEPKASQFWLDELNKLDPADFEAILSNIPDDDITKIGRDFALKLLEVNKKRILNAR